MHLTPTILEAAYNYLRATPPFKNWKLPESDAVEFHISRRQNEFGRFQMGYYANDKKKKLIPRISISTIPCPKPPLSCRHTHTLIETMAHEMVHMRQDTTGSRGTLDHGPKFKRLAAQVCKQHGFDVATF